MADVRLTPSRPRRDSPRQARAVEPISPIERDHAWDQASKAKDIQGRPPTAGEWHDRMATACEAQRRWTAAIWHLTQLESMGEDLPSTYLRRARAHLECGRADAQVREASLIPAMDDLDRVLVAEPANGQAFLERAAIELERKKWKEAIDDFSRAEQVLGGNKQIWMGRAQAHIGEMERQRLLVRPRPAPPVGDPQQVGHAELQAAIADYDRALRADPEDSALHKKMAEAYSSGKDWQRAAEEYERAARILPGDLDLRERHAASLAKQPQKSLLAIQEYATVARMYRGRGQFANAKNAFVKAISLKKIAPSEAIDPKPDRDQAALHFELAETLFSLRQPDEATTHYKEALKTDPAQWTYWRGLAQARQSAGAWAEAKDAYSNAIERQPRDVNLLMGRAWVLRQLKDWDNAALDYESLIKLEPANELRWLWLADTFLEAGRSTRRNGPSSAGPNSIPPTINS